MSMSDDAEFMNDDHMDGMGHWVYDPMEGDDGIAASSNDDNHASMDSMDSTNMAMTFFTGKEFYLLFDSLHIVSNTDFILVTIPRAPTLQINTIVRPTHQTFSLPPCNLHRPFCVLPCLDCSAPGEFTHANTLSIGQ
jgi:hypothetical protein